ncbi:MAG: helix-turn-helix domain-containing protein, partial [Bdellovibrio sp.]
ALQLLMQHSWPGHVRELRNFVERLYILASEEVIEAQDVYFAGLQDMDRRSGESVMSSFREARALFERKFLVDSLSESGGNISKTAEKIGLERSYLHRKLKLYGIEVSRNHDEGGS